MQLIHKFTPPTCSLEIWGQNSALSRWTKQQVIKNLRFQLSFDDPRIPKEEQVTISGDREQLEQIYNLVLNYTEKFLEQSFGAESLASSVIAKVENIDVAPYLKPLGLVNHELYLGDLITVNPPLKIQISALQLFDLVTALEEYKSEIAVVAELEQTPQKLILPLWMKIAVALLLTVGLTNLVLRLITRPIVTESVVSLQEEPEPRADVAEVIPPQVPKIETKPAPKPKLTEPLSSANTLPPPPAIDLPKPPPDIPNPEDYPLPEVGKTVAPEITSFPDLKPPPPKQKNTTQAESQLPQVESTVVVPPEPQTNDTPENSAARALESPETANSSEAMANRKEQIALNPDKTIDDYIRDRLSQESLSDSPIEEDNGNDNPELTAKKPNTNIPEISQIKEVKSYFEQKWQPPAELTRTLEYRLILNKDGSIQRIIPIGRASETFIDRTNLPLRGEAFVSPLKNTDQATIRLILSPDGDVTTFLE